MSYSQRVRWERQVSPSDLKEPQEVLSSNSKTGTSLNLPVINCRPTKNCAESCYACLGPIAWKNSIRKALSVNQMITSGNIERLIEESKKLQDVRLCGSGDMTMEQTKHIVRLAKLCPDTTFWGFSRKPEIAKALHRKADNLSCILSIDSSTKDAKSKAYKGPVAFGPRIVGDIVPDDKRIMVVFPVHIGGRFTQGIPEHKLDCPTSRGAEHDNACSKCRRCWRP